MSTVTSTKCPAILPTTASASVMKSKISSITRLSTLHLLINQTSFQTLYSNTTLPSVSTKSP
ncbi:hypothetical protein RHMOL_Rhmol07G0157900 [Rhododendron molle]|uniref:Uncharacterized protein n=1 Tax=Rhododendron molle TaxID=49168 RepID=A0ACC0N1Q7_RHOML|nr:hypothetical protein RHMOL_Rhmol07G0157900 [Rhododendron molle]